MEDIKFELGLFEEKVPEVFWEGVVDARKDGNEVVLEGAYIAFDGIASVYIWGYKLVSALPFFLDDTLVF